MRKRDSDRSHQSDSSQSDSGTASTQQGMIASRTTQTFDTDVSSRRQLNELQRLEQTHGQKVHEWLDEGIPREAMGTPAKMHAFRMSKELPTETNSRTQTGHTLQGSTRTVPEAARDNSTRSEDSVQIQRMPPRRESDSFSPENDAEEDDFEGDDVEFMDFTRSHAQSVRTRGEPEAFEERRTRLRNPDLRRRDLFRSLLHPFSMSNEESVFMRLEYTDREFRTIMDAMSVGGRPGMMWQRNAIEERRERNRRRTQEETERREAEQQSQRHQLQNRQAQQQAAQAAAQARAIEAQEQEQMHQQALEAIAGEHVRRQDSDTALSPIVDRDDERTRLERVRAQLAGRIDRRNSDDLILI